MALEINSQNFDTLIAGDQPVVLDFSATWCGPCQMVAPIIEELAKEYEGKVVIGKCDVDQDPELLDLSKPVRVLVNGQQVYSGMVKADWSHLVESCSRFFDPERLFPAAIDIAY